MKTEGRSVLFRAEINSVRSNRCASFQLGLALTFFCKMMPKLLQKHSKVQVSLVNTMVTVSPSSYLPFLLNVLEHFPRSRRFSFKSLPCLKEIKVTFLFPHTSVLITKILETVMELRSIQLLKAICVLQCIKTRQKESLLKMLDDNFPYAS